jgi:hypothetical protein
MVQFSSLPSFPSVTENGRNFTKANQVTKRERGQRTERRGRRIEDGEIADGRWQIAK